MGKGLRQLLGYPPLNCREIKRALVNLGFALRNQTGSHEQWVLDRDGARYKVTVSCHNEPFTNKIMKYMIHQSGVSKREFYRAAE